MSGSGNTLRDEQTASEPLSDLRDRLQRDLVFSRTSDASLGYESVRTEKLVAQIAAIDTLDALAARLTEAEEALARALWQIDQLWQIDPSDADVAEWDDDGLLSDVYDEYLTRARAVLSGDAADSPEASA